MPSAHQNWQSLGAGGMYGGATAYGAGGYGAQSVAHNPLDAARLGVGRTPDAEYPDGYLGTIRTRREDRVLDSLKARANQRSYQRGVHKGERIDPVSYFYAKGLEPDRGLKFQAKQLRQAPLGAFSPRPHLVNDGKSDMPNNVPADVNERRVSQMAHLRPRWS